MTRKPWQSTIYGAVRHPDRPAILTVSHADGWTLPLFEGENIWETSMHRITPTFSDMLQTPVWGLRQIHLNRNEEERKMEVIVELELQDSSWMPTEGYRWIESATLNDSALESDLLESIETYLAERKNTNIPPLRPPWAKPGWLKNVRSWIAKEAARSGWSVTEVRQVKQWGISAVLHIKTNGPEFYFKTTNRNMPLFVNEAEITMTLSSFFPGRIVKPFAIKPENDWMLLPPFGKLISEDKSDDHLPKMFKRFAALQIESAQHIDALQSSSVLDRRIHVLRGQLDSLIHDPEAVELLDPETREDLQQMVPTFKTLLQQLSDLNIPETLVHGDLHSSNAAINDGEIVYFDWTDACISHPFFDLHILQWLDEKSSLQVLSAYLEPWKEIIPEETLNQAVRLARVLLPLHHAVSYQQIVANLEPASKHELNQTHLILKDALKFSRNYLNQDSSLD